MKKILILLITVFAVNLIISAQEVSVTITVYHPTSKQCKGDPTKTADGSKISISAVKAGTVRWCAMSRDFLRVFKLGGTFEYGDTIMITCGDPLIDGLYVVHDTMSPRMRKHIDILTWPTRIRTGTWKGKMRLKARGKKK